jgi:hypothetical protein
MTEQIAAPRQKRLQILGDDEIENLYGFPRFTSEEQMEYFTLLPKEFVAIEQLALQFKRNLRPVLLSVEFATSSGQMPLMAAINFLKVAFQKGRALTQYSTARFPTEFIPDSTKRYLYVSAEDDQKLLRDRYEFLVYRLLRNGLESGDVFCRDSVRFRSLEDDLIDEQRWQAKATLMAATGLSILTQPIQDHLAELEQRLSARITEVNQRLRVSLYGFEHPSQYEDKGPLKPIRKINTALIIKE